MTFHPAEEEQQPPEEESGNVAPIAVSDSYSADEDTQLDVDAANGVLANDSDPDTGPQTLSAVLVDGPQHAAFFNLEADGSFTYQAMPDYFGSDSFTYKAFDGELYSAIRTVALTVGDTYDAPPDELPGDEGDDTIYWQSWPKGTTGA